MTSAKHADPSLPELEEPAPYHRPMTRDGDRHGDGSAGTFRRLLDALHRIIEAFTGPERDRPSRQPSRQSSGRSPARPSDGSSVRIEYTPKLDGDPDPGEVAWAWVPFEDDPSQGKDRPVVIVGRRGQHLVGVPLTTKVDGRETQVAVGTGAWDSQRRDSYARVERLLDLDPHHVRREGAILAPDRFAAVAAALDRLHDVTLPD